MIEYILLKILINVLIVWFPENETWQVKVNEKIEKFKM